MRLAIKQAYSHRVSLKDWHKKPEDLASKTTNKTSKKKIISENKTRKIAKKKSKD